MKNSRISILVVVCASLALVSFLSYQTIHANSVLEDREGQTDKCCHSDDVDDLAKHRESCVFNNIMGVVDVDSIIDGQIAKNSLPPDFYLDIPKKATSAIDSGLDFLMKAQHPGGGWGAGLHSSQHVIDPHAVKTDPATTSMVALAIIRSGSTFESGPYSENLKKAHDYLLSCVDNSEHIEHTITDLTGTQIQSKLGQSIDVILATQYFTRSLDVLNDGAMEQRTRECLQVCVIKIESTQQVDGSYKGGTWAGLLNSAYATNALEMAVQYDIEVNEETLQQSRNYQKSNYSVEDASGSTTDGAGVMLYSVSSSSRASATEAKRAKKEIQVAKDSGILPDTATVNVQNLQTLGYSYSNASNMDVANSVYESSKVVATQDQVMAGFGNNGGEEFLSFLQTGEGMIVAEDMEWKGWYEKVSQRMIDIQENNGSWRGHHCITSPVFCTASAVLILSINNDIDQLAAIE
jgi:sulfur transfer complex TusBCD TusB component (DsrH family)